MEFIRGRLTKPQKVVIYGREGIGKSTLASQFPRPIFIDPEDSTGQLDVVRTPRPTSWTMLREQVRYFRGYPTLYDTLVLDTADAAERLCAQAICALAQKSGIEDFGYGKGYVYLAEEFGRLLNDLQDLIDLGMNVVIVAHASIRKFELPEESGAFDRWEMKLEKKTAPLLKEWCDILLFANYKLYVVKPDAKAPEKKNKVQGGQRVLYATPHPCWDAKNRHGLKDELLFDYKEIAHCIPDRQTIQTLQTASVPMPQTVDEKDLDLSRIPIEEPPKPTPTPPTPAPAAPSSPAATPAPSAPIDPDIPKALADLMAADGVTVEEIQRAVAARGYYPADTPIANYDSAFVAGVLIGAWPQVLQVIKGLRAS